MAKYINYPEPQLGYVGLTNGQDPLPVRTDTLLTQTPGPKYPTKMTGPKTRPSGELCSSWRLMGMFA